MSEIKKKNTQDGINSRLDNEEENTSEYIRKTCN